jgi:integrase
MARKRRGHGEGGVYRRESDHRWVGSLTCGRTAEGKQKRRVVYGDTKSEVLQKLRALQHRFDAGALTDPTSLSVADWLKHWSETVGKTKRGTTQDRRRIYIDKHVVPYVGGLRLDKLRLAHLEGWLASLEADGRSAWTRHQAATVLGTALRRAVQVKLIPFNPAADLVKPRPTEKEVDVYTEAEANQLFAASRPHRLHALYALALTSGMRLGELLRLHWSEVLFDQGAVQVTRTLRQVPKSQGGFALEPPKSKRSRRTIDLPQVAVDALNEHRKRMLAEGRDVKAGPVFVTRTGTFISRANLVRQIHRPLLKRAGLPVRKFHALRHSHASALLARGRSIRAVSERLGHSNPELTLRVYAHLMPGDGKETARVLDQMFGGRVAAEAERVAEPLEAV